MALNVELGTGSATSESYASVADADAYLAARGFTIWAPLTTAEKEQALRRSTDYMEQSYRLRWDGLRCTTTQALSWPRYNLQRVDILANIVPVEVRNACILMAFKAASGELAPDVDKMVISEQVGPISVTYAAGSRETVKYRAVDNLLAPFLTGGGMNIRVVRV